jgi:hypothetical protein
MKSGAACGCRTWLTGVAPDFSSSFAFLVSGAGTARPFSSNCTTSQFVKYFAVFLGLSTIRELSSQADKFTLKFRKRVYTPVLYFLGFYER